MTEINKPDVAAETAGASVDVSIIIVSWNTRDILRDCLQSIKEQTRKPYEVIVVDNNSSDGTPEMVAQDFPECVLIANPDNRGFAGANNQGLEIAKGRYVLLLNPDMIIFDRAIDTMIDWADQNPDVGCSSCQIMEGDGLIQQTCFADPGLLSIFIMEFSLYKLAPRSRLLGWPEYRYWDRKSEKEVDVISGMFMLVPMKVLKEVGALDPAYFIYVEEADWCLRIRKAGYRCVFNPIARALHLEGGSKSTDQIKAKMYVQKQKSKIIYINKFYGLPGRLIARGIFLAAMSAKWTAFTVFNLFSHKEPYSARLAAAAIRFHLFSKEPE